MKKLMLALALLLLPVCARGEGLVYIGGDAWHATPLCAEMGGDREQVEQLVARAARGGETGEAARIILESRWPGVTEDAARALDLAPCPVCVRDGADYGDLRAVQRGGTAVLRVPDSWIQSRELFTVWSAEERSFTGDVAREQLARFIHGDAYVSFVRAAAETGEAEAEVEALWPEVDDRGVQLVMHLRHIGGAWYLCLRPDGDARERMHKSGELTLGMRLEGGPMRWRDDTLTWEDWGLRCEQSSELKLDAIDGTPVFSGDFENLRVTLFNELGVNIAVLREESADGEWLEGAVLTLDDAPAARDLNGYMDGDAAIYVCTLTQSEAQALQKDAFPRLRHPGRVTAEIVDADGWLPEDDGESYAYTVFFHDGALYIANNSDAEERPVVVYLRSGDGDAGPEKRLDAVPLGKALRVWDASEIAYLDNGEESLCAWAAPMWGDGGEVISNVDRVRQSDGGEAPDARASDETGEALPAPARELSFLSGYVDALQVGDWYLACTEKTEPGRYDSATRNDTANWRLLDGSGNVLADGLLWWPKGNDWPLQPRPFEGFEDGVDAAVLRIGEKYGLIDRSGAIVAEARYDALFDFLPGQTSTPMERDGKWGCVDARGVEVVPPRYDEVFTRFEGGCTVVRRDGKYGLLGEDGSELITPVYDSMWLDDGAEFGEASRKGTVCLFNRKGQILLEKRLGSRGFIYCYADAEPPFEYYDGDAELHGYIWPDGAEALPAIYEDADPFWRGQDTAHVQINGRWGSVRTDGSFAIPPEYEWLAGFSEGLCAAQRDGLWGFLDEDGDVAIPFQYAYVDSFANGYADAEPGENPELHGLIDREGDWVIEPMAVDHIDVGEDGVAVTTKYGEDAHRYFRLAGGGAEEIGALSDDGRWEGCLPNEDASGLAELDGPPTLEKRVSDSERLPHLDGVPRLYPLYAAFVQAVYPSDTRYSVWNDRRDDGNPVLTHNPASDAWERLSDGDADILFVPAPDPEDPVWAMLAGRGQVAEFIPLCREALVFPVNADNPVTDISEAALKGIYAGKITRWDALDAGLPERIVAYQAAEDYPDGGEARRLFERCGFEDAMPAVEGVTGYDGYDGDVYTGAVSYRNLPNAIGFAPRQYCKALLEAGEIRLLSVDGVAPTDESIADGSYPYVETLYAVRLIGNDNPNVEALLDWIQSEQGRELVRKTGYGGIRQ